MLLWQALLQLVEEVQIWHELQMCLTQKKLAGGCHNIHIRCSPELTLADLCRPRSPPPEPFLCSQASVWCSYPRGHPTSRSIVRCDSISMVSNRSLQYVNGSWSVNMVYELGRITLLLARSSPYAFEVGALPYALNLRAKVNRCK